MSIPPVTFSIEPEENGRLVYLPVAPRSTAEPARGMLGFRLRIRNNGSGSLRLTRILVDFPGAPALSRQIDQDESFDADESRTIWMQDEDSIELPAVAPERVRIGLMCAGHNQPKVIERRLAPHRSPTPQGSYRFPANTADMDFDEYFMPNARHAGGGAQLFGYDIGVRRWNPDPGRFEADRPHAGTLQNHHSWAWNKPLYAMADGVVIRARTGFDENPRPGKRVVSRMDEADAGVIGALAVTKLNATRIASVVRTAQQTLKVIIWDSSDFNRSIERRGDAEGDPVNLVAADALTGSRLVTAARAPDGGMRVIVWNVSADGNTVTRLGERGTGKVKAFSLIRLSNRRFATAVRTDEDALRLIVWESSADGSSIALLDHDFAGEISEVSLVRPNASRLVTAVRTGGGNLKLIVWDVDEDGKLQRRGDITSGSINEVKAAVLSAKRIATSVRTGSNRLQVRLWDISESGNTIKRGLRVNAGRVRGIAAAPSAASAITWITAVITETGTLKLILWRFDEEHDDRIVRLGEASAGPTDMIAIEQLSNDLLMTGVRTAGGNLKIIGSWTGGGGGNSLLILHGDELMLYAHMRNGTVDPAVAQAGAQVTAGQFIGRLGNSGASSGPHLHLHAMRAPLGMSTQEMIENVVEGDLPGSEFRPLPFHHGQAMVLAGVQPALSAGNAFAPLDGHGVYFDETAIWPGPTTPGVPTGRDEIAFHGVPAADYQALFERITGASYRLAWFDGYAVGSDLRFNLVFRPSPDPFWFADHGLTAPQYQDLVDQRKADGFGPVHVSSYHVGDDVRYAAIFHQSNGITWEAYHDLSVDAHFGRFEELRDDGFAPIKVSVVSPDSQRRYTALYEQRSVGGFVLNSFLTPSQYQTEFDRLLGDGFHVAYLDGYRHNGGVRLSAIWNREHQGVSRGAHGVDGSSYQDAYEDARGLSFRTVAVTGYSTGNQANFAAIWHK